jgi:hypothetical protein
MPPDNRITPLLPVWPTMPVKESGGKPRERDGLREEKRSPGREQPDRAGQDGKFHIDTYA